MKTGVRKDLEQIVLFFVFFCLFGAKQIHFLRRHLVLGRLPKVAICVNSFKEAP